jgi:hypothetical protein
MSIVADSTATLAATAGLCFKVRPLAWPANVQFWQAQT